MREIDKSVALKRISVPALDEILGWAFPVLDHGYVRLIDYMGDDSSIAQAARASYTEGTKSISDDKGLVNYLLRHEHTTPFEMCEIKFAFKMPMFIGEQTLRQRTASVNKESGRYSIMSDDKYVPSMERVSKQSKTNGQGSGMAFDAIQAMAIIGEIEMLHDDIQEAYDKFVSGDVDLARELARGILPANQYATFYWKIDLHNLLKFLKARLDSHAQWEIQEYARVIADIVATWVPAAWEAFENYSLNSVKFSAKEIETLKLLLSNEQSKNVLAELTNAQPENQNYSKGEWRECLAKLQKLMA